MPQKYFNNKSYSRWNSIRRRCIHQHFPLKCVWIWIHLRDDTYTHLKHHSDSVRRINIASRRILFEMNFIRNARLNKFILTVRIQCGIVSLDYVPLHISHWNRWLGRQAGRQNDIKWKQNHKYGGYNGSFLNMLHKWYDGLEKNSMNVLPFNVYM